MTGLGVEAVPAGAASATIEPEPRFLARRAFAGQPDQVRAARRWLTRIVDGFAVANDVVLACSELAANAIIHSNSGLPGGVFTVRLAIDTDFLRVEVIDQGGQWSGQHDHLDGMAEEVDDGSQSGRGLTIVAAIADAWGIAGDQEGRIAWCEIKAE